MLNNLRTALAATVASFVIGALFVAAAVMPAVQPASGLIA
jgi:hypothetical protein